MRTLLTSTLAVLLTFFLLATRIEAQLWNAETGSGLVTDGTNSDYALIQSEVIGDGQYSYHLANPNFESNWFVTDQVDISSNDNLFFLSQLKAATPSQVAKVQVATNGSNWADIYSQPGNDFPGEGSFSLKELPLNTYQGQSVQFRFMLDFSGGLAYTQTDSRTGWFVDNIQVQSDFQKLKYDIGDPSNEEQFYLEYINRARSDASAEAERLRDETTPSIVNAYSFFGINPDDIVDHYGWYVSNGCMAEQAQPLSFNPQLLAMSELHSQDMFDNGFQGHVSSQNPPAPLQAGDRLGDRADRVGYDGGLGENVFAYADSVADGHAGFAVDWGNTTNTSSGCYNPSFAGDGMQNPAGHRISIHNPNYKEVGIGVINGQTSQVGPQIVTQNFGNPGSSTFVTGVVYDDLNGNQFYDIGEGRSDVRVDIDGSAFYAISTESGAYSVPVDGDGEYSVSFSGDDYQDFSTTAVVSGGRNVKVDYLVEAATMRLLGDADGDGDIDSADQNSLVINWTGALSPGVGTKVFSEGDFDGDGDVDSADRTTIVSNWTGALAARQSVNSQLVPEPNSGLIMTLGLVLLVVARKRSQ